MTLLEIAERPDPAPVSRKRTRTERTRAELVAEYFKAHPNEWIDGLVFRGFAGGYGGWSARIREVRQKFNMHIENRQQTMRDHEFDCPALAAWDIPGACNCLKQRVYVLSEYRFVPSSERQE